MKLDSRILEGKRPLTCFDTEEAKRFIGKECYFSNYLCNFNNINSIAPRALLHNITEDKDASNPYYSSPGYFAYCLPCEWVKEPKKPEKKYRAYTLKEFIGDVNLGLGPWIRMRPVGSNEECKFLYTGYQETKVGEYICLGCYQFDFISLFKNYEIYINGEWQPFGVIDE